MVDRQQIIHMYRTLGHRKRAIGRTLDINRKTVAKVIQEYESSLASPDPEGSLETLLTRKPVYDNSSRRRKVITGVLQELIDTCLRDNARAGWEKGHVERSVEYVRGKAFSIFLRFDSLEEAQNQLSATCSRINTEEGSSSTVGKQSKLEAELAALWACPGEMGCFELGTYKVDKWSTICMKASHYSVPDTLVGKLVDVKIYSEKLVMLYNNQKVAVHQHIYHPADWSVKLEHYQNTLLRKPGAVHGSLALQKMPEAIRKLFERQFADKSKDFVLLMQYAQDKGFTDMDIIAAYQDLKNRGIARVSADQIKAMMHALAEPQDQTDELVHPKINQEQSADIEDGSLKILSELSRMMDNTMTTNES